jgi:2',3'-cyclic-nucleotide 2'-phosphodiesterase (5'-nucleotidase family)
MDDLFTMLPFDVSVVAYNLTGTLLWQLLEASVSRGPEIYSNFLQVSGLEFAFDPTRDEGQRVTSVFINGTPLDLTRVYSVAVTHSPIGRVWGRSLREVFELGEFVRDTGVFVRDALANYFKTHSPISPRRGLRAGFGLVCRLVLELKV